MFKNKMLVLLLLFTINCQAQINSEENFFNYGHPSAEGDKDYRLMTEVGYKNLLFPFLNKCNCGDELSKLQKQIDDLNEQIKSLGGDGITGGGTVFETTGELDNSGNACFTKESEKTWLIANATSQSHVATLYNKSNQNRRCFSSIEIHQLFGGDGKGSEKFMSTFVFAKIEEIRLN